MNAVEQIIRVLAFVAIAILILGLVRNAPGTAQVLNGFAGLFNTGYQAEIKGIGAGQKPG